MPRRRRHRARVTGRDAWTAPRRVSSSRRPDALVAIPSQTARDGSAKRREKGEAVSLETLSEVNYGAVAVAALVYSAQLTESNLVGFVRWG